MFNTESALALRSLTSSFGPQIVLKSLVCLLFSDLVISAQRLEGPESFIIEIEKSKVGGLLQEFEGDFGFLAQFLRLQDKRMVLINPVSITISNQIKWHHIVAQEITVHSLCACVELEILEWPPKP